MNSQHSTSKALILGSQFSLYYCLCTALSLTLVNKFEINLSPEILTFLTFMFTIISFHLICLPKYRYIWQVFFRNGKLFLMANIYSTVMWILSFLSLKYLEPAIVAVMFFGTLPLATLCIQRWKKRNFSINHEVIFAILMLLTMTLLALDRHSKLTWHYFMYVSCAVIAGISGAFYNITAKDLSIAKVSASIVMAHRFWGVVIVTGAYLLFSTHGNIGLLSPSTLTKAFSLSVISTMFPLFFMQKALEKASPQLVSYFIATVPIFIYVIELFILDTPFIWTQFILICLFVSFIAATSYINIKRH